MRGPAETSNIVVNPSFFILTTNCTHRADGWCSIALKQPLSEFDQGGRCETVWQRAFLGSVCRERKRPGSTSLFAKANIQFLDAGSKNTSVAEIFTHEQNVEHHLSYGKCALAEVKGSDESLAPRQPEP